MGCYIAMIGLHKGGFIPSKDPREKEREKNKKKRL